MPEPVVADLAEAMAMGELTEKLQQALHDRNVFALLYMREQGKAKRLTAGLERAAAEEKSCVAASVLRVESAIGEAQKAADGK